MTTQHQNSRILVVTPEVTFVRHGMGPGARFTSARAGGLGDICAAQIQALYYDMSDDGFPKGWVWVMKEAIRSNAARFFAPADGRGICSAILCECLSQYT